MGSLFPDNRRRIQQHLIKALAAEYARLFVCYEGVLWPNGIK